MYNGKPRIEYPDGVDAKYLNEKTKHFHKQQLCWKCQRATAHWNGLEPCPWMKSCTPVDGWEVTRVFRTDPNWKRTKNPRIIETFHVHSCPLFVDDKEKRGKNYDTN